MATPPGPCPAIVVITILSLSTSITDGSWMLADTGDICRSQCIKKAGSGSYQCAISLTNHDPVTCDPLNGVNNGRAVLSDGGLFCSGTNIIKRFFALKYDKILVHHYVTKMALLGMLL